MPKTRLQTLSKIGVVVSFVLTSAHPSAGTLDDVPLTIQAERIEHAHWSLETRAKNGDSEAQYLLSTLYREGHNRPRDEYRAFEWCMRAAEAGLPEAQMQLGIMYLHGEGVSSDDEKAVDWVAKAAEAGHEQAAALLDYVLYNDFTYGC